MKACAFVLHTKEPDETLQQLGKFFQCRKLFVEKLNMDRYSSGQASVYVHCQLGGDQILKITQGLEDVKGVYEVTRMIEK